MPTKLCLHRRGFPRKSVGRDAEGDGLPKRAATEEGWVPPSPSDLFGSPPADSLASPGHNGYHIDVTTPSTEQAASASLLPHPRDHAARDNRLTAMQALGFVDDPSSVFLRVNHGGVVTGLLCVARHGDDSCLAHWDLSPAGRNGFYASIDAALPTLSVMPSKCLRQPMADDQGRPLPCGNGINLTSLTVFRSHGPDPSSVFVSSQSWTTTGCYRAITPTLFGALFGADLALALEPVLVVTIGGHVLWCPLYAVTGPPSPDLWTTLHRRPCDVVSVSTTHLPVLDSNSVGDMVMMPHNCVILADVLGGVVALTSRGDAVGESGTHAVSSTTLHAPGPLRSAVVSGDVIFMLHLDGSTMVAKLSPPFAPHRTATAGDTPAITDLLISLPARLGSVGGVCEDRGCATAAAKGTVVLCTTTGHVKLRTVHDIYVNACDKDGQAVDGLQDVMEDLACVSREFAEFRQQEDALVSFPRRAIMPLTLVCPHLFIIVLCSTSRSPGYCFGYIYMLMHVAVR